MFWTREIAPRHLQQFPGPDSVSCCPFLFDVVSGPSPQDSMSTLDPTPRARSWIAAALALLAVALAPGSSWGACGRHGAPALSESSASAQFAALARTGA